MNKNLIPFDQMPRCCSGSYPAVVALPAVHPVGAKLL